MFIVWAIAIIMLFSVLNNSYGSKDESVIDIIIDDPPTPPTPVTPPTPPTPVAPIQISDTEKINIDVGGEKIPFQYIVVLEDLAAVNASTLGDTFQALNTIVEGLGAEIIYTYNSTIAGFAFKGPNQLVVDQIAAVLELDPRVKFVEQDQTVMPFETISTGIDRIDADPLFMNSRIGNLSADVDIAIIDSGIDLDHPDLNVYKKTTSIISQDSTSLSTSSNSDTLINNEIDLKKIDLDLKENTTTTFYPPFSQNAISTADDKCGHGTHVAGVAAAKHDSFGIVGIAPGARLWAIKVLEFNESTGKCEGAISSVIQAVDYITKNAKEIDVANLSLGCKCNSSALKEAIDKSVARNVIYVVAAGNIHADASSFSPANHDDVISVSAIADDDGKCGSAGNPLWIDAGNMSGYTTDDSFASFSNYGPTIDIAAPGVSINSTYLNGSYAKMGGTSIAAPHVSGAVALYKMLNQNASVNDVRTILADSGSNKSTVCDGSGRGYFTEDTDSNPEPLLYLFDAISAIGTLMSNETATFVQQDAPEQSSLAQSKSQSQPLLQQESVTETNTDVATTTASTATPATTSNFLTYENSTHGLKISYPANWTYYGTAENSGFIDIVIFEAPLEGRTDSSSALFMVSRDTLPSDRSTSLKEYADSIINQYKQSIPDFNVIESSTEGSIKLLNRPAYRILSTNVQDDITYKTLEMGTIIGNRVYLITYDAEEAEFSKYQPIGQDMINSLQVVGLLDNDKSAEGETIINDTIPRT